MTVLWEVDIVIVIINFLVSNLLNDCHSPRIFCTVVDFLTFRYFIPQFQHNTENNILVCLVWPHFSIFFFFLLYSSVICSFVCLVYNANSFAWWGPLVGSCLSVAKAIYYFFFIYLFFYVCTIPVCLMLHPELHSILFRVLSEYVSRGSSEQSVDSLSPIDDDWKWSACSGEWNLNLLGPPEHCSHVLSHCFPTNAFLSIVGITFLIDGFVCRSQLHSPVICRSVMAGLVP